MRRFKDMLGLGIVKMTSLFINGTQVGSTAAELNILDGIPDAGQSTISVGAEGGSNDITVSIQLNDANGAACSGLFQVIAYLSDTVTTGAGVCATAPDGNVTKGTDGEVIHLVTDKVFLLQSETDGDIDVKLIDSGTPTFYLVVVFPNGEQKVSGAITFA